MRRANDENGIVLCVSTLTVSLPSARLHAAAAMRSHDNQIAGFLCRRLDYRQIWLIVVDVIVSDHAGCQCGLLRRVEVICGEGHRALPVIFRRIANHACLNHKSGRAPTQLVP